MRNCFLFVSFLFAAGQLFAQVGGETEFGTDGKGQEFFSQYLFYNTDNTNVLVRYFHVEGLFKRGEFAIGPTFSLNTGIVQFQFGGDTSRSLMFAGLLITKMGGRKIIYIGDLKLATRDGVPNTIYQKLFVPLFSSNKWQLRIEDLQVGSEQSFFRIGLEFQQELSNKAHFYVAPYFDPVRQGVGGQIGLRFF